MIAVSRVSDNHDGRGGTAPQPVVWVRGSRAQLRKVDNRVNIDLAALPRPLGFLDGPWVQVVVLSLNVTLLPGHTVSVCCVSSPPFLSSVLWLVDSGDFGHHGVSYLEVLVLFEQWGWSPPPHFAT